MNPNFKRLIFFFIVLAILFTTFVFRNTIFSGTVNLQASPPYQINELGSQTQICLKDPCKIRYPIGNYTLIIQKEDYRPILLPLSIKAFSSQEITLNFEQLPQLTRVDNYPSNQTLSAQLNNRTLTDQNGRTIAVFPKIITPNEIISNKNFTLLLTNDQNYLVDHITKKRTTITKNITTAKQSLISPQGNFLAQSIESVLKITGLKSPFHTFDIILPNSPIETGQFIWLSNEKILFATNNDFSREQNTTNGLNQITFNASKKSNYLFATYDPKTGNFELIGNFPELTDIPLNLSHSNLENSFYFQSGDTGFRISL
ncbi:hypothetical protein KA119_01875 [Candidatus Gracilibacteria bacterium]|nr:hypothetical protein [Candidatus Gracilibacteria bacterium]